MTSKAHQDAPNIGTKGKTTDFNKISRFKVRFPKNLASDEFFYGTGFLATALKTRRLIIATFTASFTTRHETIA